MSNEQYFCYSHEENKCKNNKSRFIFLWILFFISESVALWSWSYGSWIYNYLCNQCLSPLMRGVLDTTLCDKVCQWLVTGWGFFLVHCCTPVSTINKTACHNITEMLLKVALITITLTHPLNHLSQKYHNIINQWKTWTWLDNLISNSNRYKQNNFKKPAQIYIHPKRISHLKCRKSSVYKVFDGLSKKEQYSCPKMFWSNYHNNVSFFIW
jgi:hypothetical protein